jgi:hypothetical protein
MGGPTEQLKASVLSHEKRRLGTRDGAGIREVVVVEPDIRFHRERYVNRILRKMVVA